MLSKAEVDMLRTWDRVAPSFRLRHLSQRNDSRFKDFAFREVYGNLITQIIGSLPANANILKTDLWNEGIEDRRNIADFVQAHPTRSDLVCIDVSRYVCESANRLRSSDFHVVRGTLLASPFRPSFNFVLDVSTVDHLPASLRGLWVSTEASILKQDGLLLISFDCRLNLFNELYHRIFTRKKYPEWTVTPSEIRSRLQSLGFRIMREHAIFIPGIFFGTHRPLFPLARMLSRKGVFRVLRNVELSKRSRFFSFIAPQYVIVARKPS
jgi:hypothetical protein